MIQYVAVLPAYAGMFLFSCKSNGILSGSPRVCGDVSPVQQTSATNETFSPRMRGCFLLKQAQNATENVLPAYAGMFPLVLRSGRPSRRSPRVCGDVSTLHSEH